MLLSLRLVGRGNLASHLLPLSVAILAKHYLIYLGLTMKIGYLFGFEYLSYPMWELAYFTSTC